MKFNVGDTIWIKWEDHYHNYSAGWHSEDDREKAGGYCEPIYIESTGIVVKDTKDRVCFAPTFSPSDGMTSGGWGVKMKRCIVDYKVLKKVKKEKVS